MYYQMCVDLHLCGIFNFKKIILSVHELVVISGGMESQPEYKGVVISGGKESQPEYKGGEQIPTAVGWPYKHLSLLLNTEETTPSKII